MKAYRCYFLDRNSRVRAFRHITCANDAAAMTIAADLLKKNAYSGAELWHRERWVAQWQDGSETKRAHDGCEIPFKRNRATRIAVAVAIDGVARDES